MKTGTFRLGSIILCAVSGVMAAWTPAASAATYYVNPSTGNDSSSGSSSSPWKTINKAKSTVSAGDIVNLMPGSYGSVAFTSSDKRGTSSSYITYRNNPGSAAHSARFSRIFFSGSTSFYTTIEGVDVENTGSNDAAIKVEGGQHVRIINCKAHGRSGGAGPTWANIYIKSGRNVLVENCEVYYSGKSAHGIQMETSDTVTVRGCHVHDIISSGIRTSDGQNYVLEYNIVHDQRADWNPSVHGSGFSIHSHNTVIRGNIIYNYGNTRPIRFYQSWAGANGYQNMLVENNLVYVMPDFPGVQWWTEFIDVGPNNVIRNNTFVGDVTITFASNADGSGLSIYNNVVTGRLQLESTSKWPRIKHGGNVLGQLASSGCGWVCYYDNFSSSGSNRIGTINVNTFFRSRAAHYPYSNGYPYQLASGASAIDYAVDSQAPSTDLLKRSRVGRADAGCYEYGGTSGGGGSTPVNTPPVANAGADQTIVDMDGDGSERVTLDGTASTDPGGKIVSYVWKRGTTTIGSGANPEVALTLGQHTITLTVTDDGGLTASDTVTVTVADKSTVLKAFWKMNENAGSVVADSSTNTNTGTLVNGPQWTGYGALMFDGADDYVSCGTGAGLNITGSLTITASINPTSFGGSGWGRIVDKGTGSTGYSFFLEEATGSLVYVVYGGDMVRSNSNVVTLNKWQHVAVVYDNATKRAHFYVDGKPAGSSAYATAPASASTSPLSLGIRRQDMSRAFHGAMSAVRVYNCPLSAAGIAEVCDEDYPFALYPIGDKEVDENATLSFEVKGIMPDVKVAIHEHKLPSTPSLVNNIFTWKAASGQAGKYEVTFSGTSGSIQDFETITVTVKQKPQSISGLVGWWRFDEMSGTTAGDVSPTNSVGTLTNGPVWTAGKSGGALKFNGNNAYVSCGTHAALNMTDSLTLMAWINPATFGANGYGRIVDKGANQAGYSFFVDERGSSIAYVVYGGRVVNSASNVIALNQWQHVAVVYDKAANMVRFYVDGQAAGTADYTTPPPAAPDRPLVIGIREFNKTRGFDGLIDEVRVYNKALTAEEIKGASTVAEQPVEVIIDNGDAATSYTGTWEVSGGSNPYGPDSVWSRDGSTYTWTFTPKVSGNYTVSMRWSGWPSRSTSVPVTLAHDGGIVRTNINQLENAGQWNVGGRYYFRAGVSYPLTITAQADPSSTCADAVRFTP
ncbi:MAG: right-handed parallel beta-helix repeat-containing protein [Phycisphaerae bacterium]|nr:right-handed parallel beta-helix repeat-containing protein [Phycisphaerae bacterium]